MDFKKRGIFLTLLLVFALYGDVRALITLTDTNSIQQVYGSIPAWYYSYAIFGLVLGVVNIVGVWMWKKWAIYSIAASSVIAVLMELFVLKPVQPIVGQIAVVLTIISAGLWFWAIYRKWKYFG